MPTSYSTLLGLALPVQGELSGTWGDTVNNYITNFLDSAVAGTQTLSTDADVTLTKTTGTPLGATSSQYAVLNCTGARTAQRTITVPAASKLYTVINATTGGYAVKIVGAGPTTGLTIANGENCLIAWNGSDFVKVAMQSGAGTFTDLTVTGNTILGDASTDTVTVNGYMGVGGAADSTSAIKITSSALSSTGQYGVFAAPVFTSSATANSSVFRAVPGTAAAAFTAANVFGYRVDDAIKGAGSTITSQHGVYIIDQTQGTNNYGITSLVSAPTSGITTTGTITSISSSGTTVTVNHNAITYTNGQTVTVAATANATALTSGCTCTILTVGTTDFTLIGAASNTVGVSFTATGAGTGTGTVTLNVQGSAHTVAGAVSGSFTYTTTTSQTFTAVTVLSGSVTVSTRWNIYASGSANNYFNGNLLVGTTTSNAAFGGKLQVEDTATAVSFVRYGSTTATNGTNLYLARSRGASVGTNTIVATGDTIGTIVFAGANGTGYSNAAFIRGYVDGVPGASNDMPGKLSFWTSADGSATPTERVVIDSSGRFGLGGTPSSSWAASSSVFQGGNAYSLSTDGAVSNSVHFASNAVRTAAGTPGSWNYLATNTASAYQQKSGAHTWYTAASGTAGTAITFTQLLNLSTLGNIMLGSATPSSWGVGNSIEMGYAGEGVGSLGNNYVSLFSGLYYGGGYRYANSTYKATQLYVYDGNLTFNSTDAVGTAGTIATLNPRFRVDTTAFGSGIVLNSTTVATYLGWLNCTQEVSSIIYLAISESFYLAYGTTYGLFGSGAGTNNAAITSASGKDLVLGAGAAERIRLFSGGNVIVAPAGMSATNATGMSSATSQFQVSRAGASTNTQVVIKTFSSTTNFAGTLSLGKSASDTLGTLTGTGADIVGNLTFDGVNTGGAVISLANIQGVGTAAAGASFGAGALVFMTSSGSAAVTERMRIDSTGNTFNTQPAPAAVNTSATLTVANLQTRIITSTTAAAVSGTLPTGTLMDGWYAAAADMAVDWCVINTGATNTFTVLAGTGHTVVGNMVVAVSASGHFRSRRTAANTWITYRVG